VDSNVDRAVVVGIGDSGIAVEVALTLKTSLDAYPYGVLVGVDNAVDRRHFTPRGVGVEVGFAGGEEEQQTC